MLSFTARVQGGQRLRKWLVEARAGVDLARYRAELSRAFIAAFPMSALRSQVPTRTGRMAQSLRLRATADGIELRGIFYAPFHREAIEAVFYPLAEATFRRIT